MKPIIYAVVLLAIIVTGETASEQENRKVSDWLRSLSNALALVISTIMTCRNLSDVLIHDLL